MKRILITLALSVITVSSDAALTSRAGGAALYDDVQDITWLADASYAQTSGYDADGLVTWHEAQTWVGTLNAANHLGVNNWRLPITTQPDPTCGAQYDPGGGLPLQGYESGCTGSELGHLFWIDQISPNTPGPFLNLQGFPFWSGTEYAPDPLDAWLHEFDNISSRQVNDVKLVRVGVIAVHPGDIGTVAATPTANDDMFSVDMDSTDNILDVHANDIDFQDPLDVSVTTGPNQGSTATVNGSPGPGSTITISYTPVPGFSGTETFTYQVVDDNGMTDTAQIEISVIAPASSSGSSSSSLDLYTLVLIMLTTFFGFMRRFCSP